jgi:hypothetical protein
VGRATGAHPGIAKLLAMLFPASPSRPMLRIVKNRSGRFFIRYHQWCSLFVPSSLRSNVKNCSWQFFVSIAFYSDLLISDNQRIAVT